MATPMPRMKPATAQRDYSDKSPGNSTLKQAQTPVNETSLLELHKIKSSNTQNKT